MKLLNKILEDLKENFLRMKQCRILRTLEMLCARKLQESIQRLPTPPLKKNFMRRSLALKFLSIETL